MTPQTILLTGAANGIGRALAFALAERGHRLGLLDRDGEALEHFAKTILASDRRVAQRVCDVTNREGVAQCAREFEQELGPTDVVVACAGIGTLTNVPTLDLDDFRRMLDVNVLGVANTIESVLPGMIMRKRGHIVGISSVAGFRGMPWMASYSASKAALSTYLEALRPALKRRGVTITTACPGFVRTTIMKDTPFRKPVKMLEPEQAARHLVRAIEKRPRNCSFPMSTALGMTFLRHMPDWMFDRLMDWVGPQALTTEF